MPRRLFAVLTVLLTLVLVVLDGAIANIALPSVATSLKASSADTVWVVSSYQLAVIIALLPCGALGEIYGSRRIYLTGIAIFTLASALCAFSPTLPALIAARFLQGLGGGAMMSLGTMLLRFIVPQRLLGTIIGVNAMTVALSSAAGPGIGGAILAVADWPWLFAVNLPIGLLILAVSRVLPKPPGRHRKLDLLVVAVNAAMFILFFTGADLAVRQPVMGLPMMLVSVFCLAWIIRRERPVEAPLIPVDLFRNPAFRVAVVGSVSFFAAQMMSLVALPFYLQHQLKEDVTLSGLLMIPWPVAGALLAPLSGKFANYVASGWLCLCGGLTMGGALIVLGLFGAAGNLSLFLVTTVIAGAGFALFQTPNNRTLLLSAPRARGGAAGAMQGTARLVGQTIGAIGMSLIFALLSADQAPLAGVLVAGLFAIAAGMISTLRIRFEAVD